MRPPDERLPHPKQCNACTSTKIILTRKGNSWIWYCENCEASVSCHPNSYDPMGVMANVDIRRNRSIAHHYFDKLWKDNHMTRREAYAWLASKLKISFEQCHISQLGQWELEKAIEVSKKFLNIDNIVKFKRDKKRNARIAKQRNREQALIKRRRQRN